MANLVHLKCMPSGSVNVQALNQLDSKKSVVLSDGHLRLYNLQQCFPGASTLQFCRDHMHRILIPRDGIFYAPHDGWGDRTYYVEVLEVLGMDNKAGYKNPLPPGEEPTSWDSLPPWEILSAKNKTMDTLYKHISPELTPVTTSLLSEITPLGLNDNFDKLYGDYDKLYDDPMDSMFKRMDLAVLKRKQRQEEEMRRKQSNSDKRSRSRDRSGRRRRRSRVRLGRRSRSRERADRRRSRSRERYGLTRDDSFRRSRSSSRDIKHRKSSSRSQSHRRSRSPSKVALKPERSRSKSTRSEAKSASDLNNSSVINVSVSDANKSGDTFDEDVQVVDVKTREDKVGELVTLSSSEDEREEPNQKHTNKKSDRDAWKQQAIREAEERYRKQRDELKRDKERYEKERYERERYEEERYLRERRRSLSADRRRRELEEEEAKTRAERHAFAEERRKLQEERRRVEERLKDEQQQEKWVAASDDFLKKLGIDPVTQPTNNYREFIAHDRDDDVQTSSRYSDSKRDAYSASRRSLSREASIPQRDVSPDLLARYGNFDRTHSLQETSRRSRDSEHQLASGSGSFHEQDRREGGGRGSRYSPPKAHDGLEFIEQLDIDFRKLSGPIISNARQRSVESDNTSYIQNQFSLGAGSRHSSSPEIEEVRFGKTINNPSSSNSTLSFPEPPPPPSVNQDQPLHSLKPGNYLVIAVDLISLGSGISSELYQIGAYTIHGETFVSCIEPVLLKEEAENHKELPMVLFKGKYHVNNRQTGIMEQCHPEQEVLRNLTNFIATNIKRVRPHYTGAVLVCDSNYTIGNLTRRIKSNNLDGQFWSRVSAVGSIEYLSKEHPNGRMLLRGWEQNLEDIYYELFKRMRPFDKHFSDEKAKFCYEVLVKLLDTNPDYNNYFKDYTFTRQNKVMQKILNPTFFLNKWETFAPLRLFVIRALKSEREGMHEDDFRYLPSVDEVSKKICRNLIDAGFIFEELLDMAKAHGLSATELQLRTVLLQRMAGQPRNVIDTAIQTTKLVTAFLVGQGHKTLEDMLEEVRNSAELKKEYEEGRPSPPVADASTSGRDQGASSSSARPPSLMSIDVPLSEAAKAAKKVIIKDSIDAQMKNFRNLTDVQKEALGGFRKYIFNIVMTNQINEGGHGWKNSQLHRCIEVLLKVGLVMMDLVKLHRKGRGHLLDELDNKVKPIYNKEGPAQASFNTYKSWLMEYVAKNATKIESDHRKDQRRKDMLKHSRGAPAGIPKSFLKQQIDGKNLP